MITIEEARAAFNNTIAAIKQVPIENIEVYMDGANGDDFTIHPNGQYRYNPHAVIVPEAGLQAEVFALYVRTEEDLFGNKKLIYQTNNLFKLKIRIDSEFKGANDQNGLLERDFISSEMIKAFNFNEKPSAKYMVDLFKYFVHDGANTPLSISDIEISSVPKTEVSETIADKFPEESKIYIHPTDVFGRKYESWNVLSGQVWFNTIGYRNIVSKDEISLGEALKDQYLSPCLQLLIKQWIVYQFVASGDAVKQDAFFNIENIDEVVRKLQADINNEIRRISEISMNERQKLAQAEKEQNPFRLSPRTFQVVQRLPWLKLILAYGRQDIHAISEHHSMSFINKAKFYIDSYLNLSVSRYLIDIILKNVAKSKGHIQNIIKGKRYIAPAEVVVAEQSWFFRTWSFVKKYSAKALHQLWHYGSELFLAIYDALKVVYLMLWLPFLATFFMASGLSSVPFSLFRKMFNISLGSKFDKAITGLEALKNIALLWLGIPIAYGLFSSWGAAALGSVGLELGARFANIVCLVLVSPFLAEHFIDHRLGKFPRWVMGSGKYRVIVYKDPNSSWYRYQAESGFPAALKDIAAFAALRFVSIHGFFAALTIGVVSALAVMGKVLHITKTFLGKKINAAELRIIANNANNAAKFSDFLRGLATRVDEQTDSEEDNRVLEVLNTCKLSDTEKQILKTYLDEKVKAFEIAVEINGSIRLPEGFISAANILARQAPVYLPSKKLVDSLHANLSKDEQLAQRLDLANLKTRIDQIHEIYSSPCLSNKGL